MLRTAIRNLLAHKARLTMSALAVVLGVAFVSGTLTFTDALNKTFTDLFKDAAADVSVEPKAAFDTGMGGMDMNSASSSLPASMVEKVRAADGVAAAAGYVQADGVYVLDRDGHVADTGGAPGIGISWTTDPKLNSATLIEGRAPTGTDEVAIDSATTADLGYHVGDKVTVLTTGPRLQATLVGTFRFGQDGGLAGASMTAFETATAQRLLLAPGRFTEVGVAAEDGTTHAQLASRLASELGSRYQVTTKEQKAADQAASLEDSLAFINTFLLVFAGVALFVGSFLILNTFSMLVAQRTRELALLRALGASRRQVTRSVLLEAGVLGLLGSTIGLAGGFALAYGLKAMFGQFGLTIDGALSLTAGTVAWSYVIGVVITLVAAYLPARRAAKVPPVAAMRADLVTTPRPLHTRTIIGVTGAPLAATALGAGTAGGTLPLVAVGAVGLLVAVIILSPVLAVPFVQRVGRVLPRLAGTTGRLAKENAMRNPRRTAATSSALMIGLALVTGFSIIGASARASIDRTVDDVLRADYVMSAVMGQPFTAKVANQVRRVDGVKSVVVERYGTAKVAGHEGFFSAYDPAVVGDALAIDMTDGKLADLAPDTILVSRKEAGSAGLSKGDSVRFEVANGQSRRLRVAGAYGDDNGLGPYVIAMDTYTATGGVPLDQNVYVTLDPTADAAAAHRALDRVVAAYPVVQLRDADGYKQDKRAGIDQLLALINALLALSVLIAALGVVNTLVLSVTERTREVGLMRALGMNRRQVRRMVRLEAVVISLYGAVLGIGLGTVLGVVLTTVLHSQGLVATAVPVPLLAFGLALAAVIGLVAAAVPARHAARLNVLDAISTA
ncbi:ABC transporter permease [Nocardioides marmoribigeumensis]|uniref:ABC transport system permease protein n=1 Tax=Nocardioides marmoribigeumensis TaxID=433649 RepID=A0ABU2BVS5_9ACTN|nr:FtsX-like permease family protein [Nocardioides marmoribigeumensis]MDR7362114.1 putative ABC transport system permease protein [Nocardioides marmoribigeumensis]